MGCRDNTHVHEEYTWIAMQKSYVFKAYTTIIYSNSHTYVGFLKASRVHIKTHFQGISGNFQTFVSSGKFQLTEIPFQRCRDEVKQSYITQDMVPPRQVFFQ